MEEPGSVGRRTEWECRRNLVSVCNSCWCLYEYSFSFDSVFLYIFYCWVYFLFLYVCNLLIDNVFVSCIADYIWCLSFWCVFIVTILLMYAHMQICTDVCNCSCVVFSYIYAILRVMYFGFAFVAEFGFMQFAVWRFHVSFCCWVWIYAVCRVTFSR